MVNRPPDIRSDEVIEAQWLNDAKNSSVIRITGGPGISVRESGGIVTIACTLRKGGAAPIHGAFDSQPTLGSAAEGSETADATTWDRDAQAENEFGVREYYVSRVVYDDTGDGNLYAFVRYRDFDSLGRLKFISAETRITVDAPDNC